MLFDAWDSKNLRYILHASLKKISDHFQKEVTAYYMVEAH